MIESVVSHIGKKIEMLIYCAGAHLIDLDRFVQERREQNTAHLSVSTELSGPLYNAYAKTEIGF